MAEDSDKDAAAPSGNRMQTVMIAASCAALAGGAGMFFASRNNGGTAHVSHESEGGGEGEEAKGEGEGSAVVTLPSFVANIADDGSGDMHYLKCTIALELNSKNYEKLIEPRTPRIRNAVLLYLSNLKLADTQGMANKQKILAELRKRISEALGKDAIAEIYLTDFVIQ